MTAANVRCRGRDVLAQPSHSLYAWEPCSWKGDRTPRWWPLSYGTHGIGRWGVTAEPCPDCGGQVEMIPREDAL